MSKGLAALCLGLAGLCATPGHAQDATYSPDELLARYTHWQDQSVTIAAYPALFMSPGRWDAKWMKFGAMPEPKAPALVECKNLTPPNEDRIASADLVILRGTFVRRQVSTLPDAPNRVLLDDCEVLEIGGEMPQGGDPWHIGETPVAIDALHSAVFDLIGETVRVTGYYWGKTWSSASDETRHDMQETAEFGGPKKPIGCFQEGKIDAPQAVLDNRENTVIAGEVALTAFSRPDRVDIGNCRFVLPD
ncbi:hypothetical protein [Vannielia sp.]|uniref:hypothetical protein n=1 Tax=Vannielia sp. TaxID=2813045 RepID=UPI00261B146C|nr:hypothetical protein [Vannielia sp.]MDF1871323.1 hypothetical protein [Vannielia sp.]